MTMVGRRKSNYHLPPRVYLKHGAYYYVTPANKWLPLGKDLADAKRKLVEIEHGQPVAGEMADLIDRYMRDIAPKKALRTYKDNQIEAAKLRAVFGMMDPGDVRPQHVAQYLDIRAKDGAAVRGNREKALLSHMFSMGMRWGVVDSNPCRGIARNPEKPRQRYVTDEEFAILWQLASPLVRAIMDLAYLTGQRKGDLLKLRLDQLKSGGIEFRQGKTGKRLLVKWSPALHAAVDHAKALDRQVRGLYLLCNRMGQPYTDGGFLAIWTRLMTKAVKAGAIDERFTFHDLRAKAGTDAKKLGRDAQKLLGHDHASTTDVYLRRRIIEEVDALK